MAQQDPQALRVLVKLQHLINTHQSLFDSIETISVTPKAELQRGEPDWTRPFIEVRARRLDDLKKRLPPQLDGVPVRIVPASLYEQSVRAVALARSDATPQIASTAWRTGIIDEAIEARDYSGLTYEPMVPSKLIRVEEPMKLIIHVSPEAGWEQLRDFLKSSKRWTVAMYDLTAPHVIDRLEEAVSEPNGEISLVLDRKVSLPSAKELKKNLGDPKANDRKELVTVKQYKEHFVDRFHFSWAAVGYKAQFPSAYHIKVAVRDKKSFWLSSGNLQSSNQPDIDFMGQNGDHVPSNEMAREFVRYNREWHVICENDSLAEIYEDYIQRDLDEAEGSPGPKGSEEEGADEALAIPGRIPDEDFVMEMSAGEEALAEAEAARLPIKLFPPLVLPADPRRKRKVQPLLTPDNYADNIVPLIRGASKRLWFQNQSLSVIESRSDKYDQLLQALKKKTWDMDDCKIIFRDYRRANTLDYLRSLKEFGFNMDCVRVMKNCHTKGILLDSLFTVIGSHNWTNEGTTYNRDASLIFEDQEISAYLEEVFAHDWENLAYSLEVTDESVASVLFPGEAQPEAVMRVPLDPNNDGSDA
jgi:PLD-like domain